MSFFQCQHCHAKFITEHNFNKHNCDKLKRKKSVNKTNKGRTAYMYYLDWLKHRGYREQTQESFINSRYYNSFIKFTEFCKRMAIPNVDEYMKFMIKHNFLPSSWYSFDVYEYYIEHFDSTTTPEQLTKISVDTIFELCKILECEPRDVFKHLTANDIIKMIQARKITPWILLVSDKFKDFLINYTTKEERIILETIINPAIWDRKFEGNPVIVKRMKKIAKELNI